MNVLKRFTLKNLLKNRMRTLITVVGVILSVAMITAVSTIISSTRQFTLDLTVEQTGSWHGKIAGLSAEKYEILKQSEEIDRIVALQEIGYAEVGQATNKHRPYVMVGAADSTLWQMFSLHLTAGRLPQNDRELLLPEGYQTSGAEPAALGDVITLTLGDRISTRAEDSDRVLGQHDFYQEGEEFRPREERTYTVTGFFEDFPGDSHFAAGYTALTVPSAETAACQTAYFTLHDMGKTQKFIRNFCDRQNAWGSFDVNGDFLLLHGYASEIGVFAAIGGMVAVILSIVLISAVALIYNAFAISVSERTKQFGVFSSVGATRTQLRRSVLFEGLAIGTVGIPLGVGAGILGIGITFAALGDAFRRIININSHVMLSLHVSWISVGISALLGLITILISAYIPARRAARRPAIEAIRQSADIKLKAKTVKTSRLTQWLFGFEGTLASKNFKRSRKKYRAVVFSLFISVVLFISTGAFCHYVLSSVDSTFGGVGYDLRVDILSENLHGEREEQLISQLRAQPNITAAQYITFGYLNTWIAPENLTEDGEDMFRVNETPGTGSVEIVVQAVFMDQNDYAAYAAQLGLGGDGAAGAIVLNRTSYWTGESGNRKIKTFSVLRESLKELTIRRFVPEDGWQYEGSFADETGQIMAVLYNRRTGESKQVLQSELPVSEFPLKLARFTATEPFCTTNVQHGVTMIFPKSRMQEVLAMFGAETSDLSRSLTLQCSDHRAAYRAIAEVLKQNGYSEDLIYNRAESVETDRAMATVIRVFAYGFITLIALIALTNAFNTISTNVQLRRREFAMLRSVGMTRRGLHKAAFFECLLYTGKSLIYGLPVACGVSYLIWRAVTNMWVQEYHLPWDGILTVTLAVFAVVSITTMYSLHQIEKEEIVEAVKNENL